MELTTEQKDIIESLKTEDPIIKINAYAGSGKTTMITELIKEIRKTDKDCGIIYLVFNKSNCSEAKIKFADLGLNVDCFTAHAFALKRLMIDSWLESKKTGVNKKIEVISTIYGDDYLALRNGTPKYKYVSYAKVNDLFTVYTKLWADMETFVKNLEKGEYEHLLTTTPKLIDVEFFMEFYKLLLSKGMYTHGMYLKEYATNCRDIINKYKYVFLDEAQDLNPFMLKIVEKIKYEKMYVVGDTYQQIYQWNGAINALEKFDNCRTYPLSISFRITDKECKIANLLLSKYQCFREGGIKIKNIAGKDTTYDKTKQTVLFRTNGTMFTYAVDYMLEGNNKVHFMDIKDGVETDRFETTFAVLLYMFSKLMGCNRRLEEDLKKMKKMFKLKKSCKEVDLYIKMATDEHEDFRSYLMGNAQDVLPLDLMKYFRFYMAHEDNILEILNLLKNSESIENPDKEYWLCTAHGSKGHEWDNVKVASDKWKMVAPDDINLMYVACTRGKKHLDYSEIQNVIEVLYEKEPEEVIAEC